MRYLLVVLTVCCMNASASTVDSTIISRPNYSASVSTNTAVIMHATTGAVNPSTYTESCFPATSSYTEALLNTAAVGGYGHTNQSTIMYRCLRTGAKGAMPSYNGWQSNPNNSSEVITTSYTNFADVWASLTQTTFSLTCLLNIQGYGGYTYQNYGFNIAWNDIYGNTQTASIDSNHSGGNCSTGNLNITQTIPPGWVGLQAHEYQGAGGSWVNCNGSGYQYFYLPANKTGHTCSVQFNSPQGPPTGCSGCNVNNCSVSVSC